MYADGYGKVSGEAEGTVVSTLQILPTGMFSSIYHPLPSAVSRALSNWKTPLLVRHQRTGVRARDLEAAVVETSSTEDHAFNWINCQPENNGLRLAASEKRKLGLDSRCGTYVNPQRLEEMTKQGIESYSC